MKPKKFKPDTHLYTTNLEFDVDVMSKRFAKDVDGMEQQKNNYSKYMNKLTTLDIVSNLYLEIMDIVHFCLKKYFLRTDNEDADNIDTLVKFFCLGARHIEFNLSIIERMLVFESKFVEDYMITYFGIESDEVYAFRVFSIIFRDMEKWDTKSMWNDCSANKRIAGWLRGECV